jgi:hypothetical protein
MTFFELFARLGLVISGALGGAGSPAQMNAQPAASPSVTF